jgi:2-iminobutanoate/2-iminopropanoate deaminase
MSFETPAPEGIGRPIAPYSPVVVSGDLVFVSGQVPFDEGNQIVSDDFEAQARQVFANLGRCLEAAGCGFADVVKVNAYVSDFDVFGVFNAVYAEHFTPPLPARTTVRAGLYGFHLEVDAIARRPASDRLHGRED